MTLPNFDFMQKLKWNPAYIAAPGSYKQASDQWHQAACKDCRHFLQDHLEMPGKDRLSHSSYCGKVVAIVGRIKKIKPESLACEQFEATDNFQKKLDE